MITWLFVVNKKKDKIADSISLESSLTIEEVKQEINKLYKGYEISELKVREKKTFYENKIKKIKAYE